MQINPKKKICIVTSSLGKGGAEKSSATLSKMLFNSGYEVHIVSVLNKIEFSYEGVLFNLGAIKEKNDTLLGRINRLIQFKTYLKRQQFDCIIDNRSRVSAFREFILTSFIFISCPVIYVIHNFKTSHAFSKFDWLSRYLYKTKTMVAVSKEAKEKFKKKFKLKDSQTVYNAFDLEANTNQGIHSNIEYTNLGNYILYFGRIDDKHKNLKLLLKSFKMSKLPDLDYKLLILGDGPDLNDIKQFSKSIELDANVIFKHSVSDPFPFVSKAKFTVLTSRNEGFPMVLIEALSLGTPVISMNCKSGPKEVVVNEQNGLLVDPYNEISFSDAMNRFVSDEVLYTHCKNNAKESVQKFSMENISKDWKRIIESTIENNDS